jgi:hypothetical protein
MVSQADRFAGGPWEDDPFRFPDKLKGPDQMDVVVDRLCLDLSDLKLPQDLTPEDLWHMEIEANGTDTDLYGLLYQ